jgi:hypothetical protein
LVGDGICEWVLSRCCGYGFVDVRIWRKASVSTSDLIERRHRRYVKCGFVVSTQVWRCREGEVENNEKRFSQHRAAISTVVERVYMVAFLSSS